MSNVNPPDAGFVPVTDVLARDASWRHACAKRVLGAPVVCWSNSRDVCDRFDEAFRVCPQEDAGAADGPTLTVRVAIVDWPDHASPSTPVRAFALDGPKLLLHSPGGVAAIDPQERNAVAFVSAAFAADRIGFTRHLLEAMTLALLTHYDRHPVHAAAIVHAGRALLLTGPSGAGKSTLAHVAHAAGLSVLSEDTVWIQQQPHFRVWGLPRAVHLRDGEGPDKLAVPLTRPAAGSTCFASSAVVCLLDRGHGVPQLERLQPEAIARVLMDDVASGFDRYPERHRAVVRQLAEPGGWRLSLTDDAAAARPLLEQMLFADAP